MIKKGFFYADIFLEGFMIIQMIMGDIAKNSTGKIQTGHPMLMQRMRTHLHEDM